MSSSVFASGRSKVIARTGLCFVAVLMAALALGGSASAAPNGPLIVRGTVYDEQGDPLEGANVVVTDLRTLASGSFDTLSNGFYFVSIMGGGQWDVGDTIEAVATAPGGGQATNSSVTTVNSEEDGLYINVSFETAIPQLAGSVGLAVAAGLVGLVAVVAVGIRRR